MNICIIGTNIPPVLGGLETYTYELARQLVKKKHHVCLVGYRTFKDSPLYEKKDDINIYRIPNFPIIGNKLYFLSAFFFIKKLHKIFNFNVVHAQTAAPAGFIGYLINQKYKVPYIITSHGYDLIVRGKQFFVKPFIKCAFNHVHKVIGVSREMSKLSVDEGSSQHKTITLANPVDTDLFSPSFSGIRDKLGIADNAVLILALRRLHPKTGVQYIVQLAPEILKEYPRTHFLVVGSGPIQNYLMESVKKAGIDNSFSFIGGIPNNQVVEYVRGCDFGVFPSLAEATSIACLEIMSCAKPVIVSNVGGLPEIVTHEKTGIIVDFKRSESIYEDYGLPDEVIQNLKNGIKFLIENKSLREQFGYNAREYVKNNFSWKIYIEKILNIYEEAQSGLKNEF